MISKASRRLVGALTICISVLAVGPVSTADAQKAPPEPARLAHVAPATSAVIPSDLQGHLDRQEREILVQALRETGFNRTAAAARLGLSLRQIRYRIARLAIAAPGGDEPNDAPA